MAPSLCRRGRTKQQLTLFFRSRLQTLPGNRFALHCTCSIGLALSKCHFRSRDSLAEKVFLARKKVACVRPLPEKRVFIVDQARLSPHRRAQRVVDTLSGQRRVEPLRLECRLVAELSTVFSVGSLRPLPLLKTVRSALARSSDTTP